MKNLLILFIIMYLIRTFVYFKLFPGLEIKQEKALVPIVGALVFLKKITTNKIAASYVVFGILFIVSSIATVLFGEQMKAILAQGMDTYARVHGSLPPYHTLLYISKAILIVSSIGLTITRFIVCGDVQKAFGRLEMEKWMMFLLPPVGYLGLVTHDFKYYGNPYEEGFIDFSIEI